MTSTFEPQLQWHFNPETLETARKPTPFESSVGTLKRSQSSTCLFQMVGEDSIDSDGSCCQSSGSGQGCPFHCSGHASGLMTPNGSTDGKGVGCDVNIPSLEKYPWQAPPPPSLHFETEFQLRSEVSRLLCYHQANEQTFARVLQSECIYFFVNFEMDDPCRRYDAPTERE